MARGIERRKIFLGPEDDEEFLRRIEKAIKGTGTEVLAWSLMPNHFHLLLRSGEVGLSTVMRRLMTGYVVSFNLRHRRHGHLFQNRYKSVVCEEESYLLELVRYIHLNPLRARVVHTLDELAGYPFSGHSVLLGKIERPWQSTADVLARFDPKKGATHRYGEFVAAGVAQGRRPELVGGGLQRSAGGGRELTRRGRRREEEDVYDERVLGSSAFVSSVLREAQGEEREVRRRALRGLGVGEIARTVAELSGVGLEELRSGTRRRQVVEARRALAQVAVGELGHRGSAVARYLGVATSTANRGLGKGEPSPLARRLLAAIENM
jgi:REP element-mobilizing transposase RayT